MLIEFLSFAIMVPLVILAWRGVAAFLFSRNPSSRVGQTITLATGGGV